MTLLKVNSNPVQKPFSGLVDEIFNHPYKWLKGDIFADGIWGSYPPVNIHEDKEAYNIEVLAPGLDKSDFKVNVEGDLLTISAARKEEKSAEDKKQVRKEFSFQAFKRSFTLNDAVDTEKISARYENGVLYLNLAKKTGAASGTKEIAVE